MRARKMDEGRARRGLALVLALALIAALAPLAGPAGATGTYSDDDGNVHEANIEQIASLGITMGCNPPANSRYCPGAQVTRGQMAAFLVRTFGFTAAGGSQFTDTIGNVFAGDIDKLATAGITRGCNPPANTHFCPEDSVTRGQMAAFLVRALELQGLADMPFTDTKGHVFESDISGLAAAGITRGCNPPANSHFCPDDPVLRDQMATFLTRAHGMLTTGSTNPTATTSASTSSTTTSTTIKTTTSTTLPSTTSTTVASGSLALRVVSDPDRNNDRALAGARLAGNIYVVAVPDTNLSVSEVRFWIDDADRSGPPATVEGGAPWDLGGTEAGDAVPWNTAAGDTMLIEGSHTITAVAFGGGQELAQASATFTIDNLGAGSSPTDQVHLSWVGDTSTTMTVVWRTDSTNIDSQVRWAKKGTMNWTTVTGAQKSSGVTNGTLHEATITGLTASTEYDFQVAASSGGWSTTRNFETAPGPTGTFDALYFADTGLAGRLDGLGVGVRQSITAMGVLTPDLLLPGGDYAYNATGQCVESDGRFSTTPSGLNEDIDTWFRQMNPLIDDIPMMPTYGNHEVILCEGFPAWADRFATPTGVSGPNVAPLPGGYDPPAVDNRGTYSFDVGAVHFISLLAVTENSALDAGVFSWLEQDILDAEAGGAQWIVPYFHATPISHGDNHFTNAALRNQLAPLFEEHDIPLVLFSHDQSYERTFPITNLSGGGPTKQSSSQSCYIDANPGVVWLKVSPSGKHSNKSASFSPWRVNPPSWVAHANNTMHHFSRVTASPNELRVRTYGHDGLGSAATVIDDFSIMDASC